MVVGFHRKVFICIRDLKKKKRHHPIWVLGMKCPVLHFVSPRIKPSAFLKAEPVVQVLPLQRRGAVFSPYAAARMLRHGAIRGESRVFRVCAHTLKCKQINSNSKTVGVPTVKY